MTIASPDEVSEERRRAIVALLLQHNADASVKDSDGYDALAWAEVRGYTTIVELLEKASSSEDENSQ